MDAVRAGLFLIWAAALLPWAGVLAAPPVAAQDTYTAIPGTRVLLAVPERFELASDFVGIIRPDAATSIHVAELPTPLAKLRASFTHEQLAAKALSLIAAESVDSEMGPASLLNVTQRAQGREFRKWLLLGGDATRSVLLTATAPAPVADDLAASPAVTGSVLVLLRRGAEGAAAPGDPIVVVARYIVEVPFTDLAAFSTNRLEQTENIASATVRSESELTIAGLPAYEIVASASSRSGLPLLIYQAVVLDERHYILIQGHVDAENELRYLDQFRAVARSLSLRASSR